MNFILCHTPWREMVRIMWADLKPFTDNRDIRILVVEDDPSSRWLLCTILQKLGFDCLSVENGLKGIEAARSFAPQVIIMDLMMPILDGLEATRRLKADDDTKEILVLALSANATATGEREARSAGCDDFMAKPVSLDRLVPWLCEHV